MCHVFAYVYLVELKTVLFSERAVGVAIAVLNKMVDDTDNQKKSGTCWVGISESGCVIAGQCSQRLD